MYSCVPCEWQRTCFKQVKLLHNHFLDFSPTTTSFLRYPSRTNTVTNNKPPPLETLSNALQRKLSEVVHSSSFSPSSLFLLVLLSVSLASRTVLLLLLLPVELEAGVVLRHLSELLQQRLHSGTSELSVDAWYGTSEW